MAALDLTSRVAVLAYLTAQLPSEPAAALEALLDASAGSAKTDCDDTTEVAVTTYRPWWVMGNVLQSNPSVFENVKSAAGSSVTYRDPVTAMRALMRRQAAFDQLLCSIPAGFEAVAIGGAGSSALSRAYA